MKTTAPQIGESANRRIGESAHPRIRASAHPRIVADVAAVIALTGLAAALRFWRLGKWGLFYDETATVDDAIQFTWDPNAHVTSGTNLPTVFFFLTLVPMRWAYALWGVNEWSSRFVPAVAGVVAVPLCYALLSRMSCRTLGWLGALLITVSPWHVYHSQEARFYPMLFLFGGATAFSFYLGLERASRGWMFAAAVSLFLSLLTHTSAVFLAPALVAYVIALWVLPFDKPLGLNWRTLKWFVLPLAIGGLLMSPMILIVVKRWGMRKEDYGYSPSHIVSAVLYNFGVPLILIAGFGLLESLRRRERIGLFAAIYGGVPLALLLTATFLLHAAMGPRYLLSSLPAYFLLAGYGGVQILRCIGERSNLLKAGLVAMMLTVQLPMLMSYYVDGDRADYRRAANFLKENAGEKDVILAPQSNYTLKHYLGRFVKLLPVSEGELRKLEQPSDETRWIVVVVGRGSFLQDEDRLLERWLMKHARMVYEYRTGQFDRHVHDIRVYRL
jgi:4-amino-4-deoxy-L-arabinose transferase-like glycosyltransferase